MTSILAGVVIFSVLGYMAKIQDIMVAEVVKSGESYFLPIPFYSNHRLSGTTPYMLRAQI